MSWALKSLNMQTYVNRNQYGACWFEFRKLNETAKACKACDGVRLAFETTQLQKPFDYSIGGGPLLIAGGNNTESRYKTIGTKLRQGCHGDERTHIKAMQLANGPCYHEPVSRQCLLPLFMLNDELTVQVHNKPTELMFCSRKNELMFCPHAWLEEFETHL